MAEPDDYEEDIFADVYDQEEPLMRAPEPVQPSVQAPIPIPTTELDVASPPPPAASNGAMVTDGDGDGRLDYSTPDGGQQQEYARHAVEEDNYGPIGIKEDG